MLIMELLKALLTRCILPHHLLVDLQTPGIGRSLERLQAHSNLKLAEKAKELLSIGGELLQVCPINLYGKLLHIRIIHSRDRALHLCFDGTFHRPHPFDRCNDLSANAVFAL